MEKSQGTECANAETIKLLVSLGAEVDAADMQGRTPLFFAAASDCVDAIRALVSNGARVDSRRSFCPSAIHHTVRPNSKAFDTLVELGLPVRDLLYSRLCDGDLEMVKKIVVGGYASINTLFADDFTMLHQAAMDGHTNMVRWLVSQAPEMVHAKTPDLEEQPLSLAAECGYKDVVKVLLENGADVNWRDKRGWTPLRWASHNNHRGVMKLLKDAGGRV